MDAAYLASVRKSGDRYRKVAQREESDRDAILPTSYEGYDAPSGTHLYKTMGNEAVVSGMLISNTTPRLGDAVMPVPTQGGFREIHRVRRKQSVISEGKTQAPTVIPNEGLFYFEPTSICVYQGADLGVCGNIYGSQVLIYNFDRNTGEISIEGLEFIESQQPHPTPQGDVIVGQRIDALNQYHEIFYDFTCLDDYLAGRLGLTFQLNSLVSETPLELNYEIRLWQSINGAPFVIVAQALGVISGIGIDFANLYDPSLGRIPTPCSTPGTLNVRFRMQFRREDSPLWFPGTLP